VAGSSAKLVGDGAQHGIATAAAAFLCNEYETAPRDLYDERPEELIGLMDAQPATSTALPAPAARGGSGRRQVSTSLVERSGE
jgi:hypothetical protein